MSIQDQMIEAAKKLREIKPIGGLNEIKFMSNAAIKEGEPVVLMHPNDFKRIKETLIDKPC